MAKFQVFVPELYQTAIEVEADSPQEASAKVRQGKGRLLGSRRERTVYAGWVVRNAKTKEETLDPEE